MHPLARVSGIVSGGKWHSGTSPNWIYGTKPNTAGWYAQNQDNGFVEPTSYGNADIICHRQATVGGDPVPVSAGSQVDLQWTMWPESHKGPVITYMAAVDGDFASVKKESLQWFKIAEGGDDDGAWASDQMISNNGTATFTVPSTLKPGKYVVRHEIIALHSAQAENGAQNYTQCINVEVAGQGSEVPSGVVGTSLYKSTDPGILVNIYSGLTSYEIPGPVMTMATGNNSRFISRRVSWGFVA